LLLLSYCGRAVTALLSILPQLGRACKASRGVLSFPGDIIHCGTPENVGLVVAGDVMTGHIDGIYEINVKVV
jgi:hypothetical protein